ncbi:MAG: TonB-dependent receptor [Prevotella sp.]|nr:TonB-dependent receptor [Prevotella sp.]
MKRVFTVAALCAAIGTQAEVIDTLKSVELQNVQVVSTRAAKNTPVAFTNMGADQLKSVNYGQDVPYLLSLTPSVTMTSDAGNGIGYTSLRVRGTDPSRINITANGIPMNDAESATVFWVNMGDFASSVQSMQIQRGVGTSTNGAGAFGATLNMQTENIGLKPFVGVDVSGGSYYSHKETVRFGTGLLDGHWGVQGRLSNIGSKGYLDRASTKLNSYLLQAGWFGENTVVKFITWNGQEETYHAWNYTSKYEQSLYGRTYNSCGLMTTDAQGNPTSYYDDQTDNYHQQNYQLLWNQRLGRLVSTNVALHYTKGQGYYQQFQSGATQQLYGSSWKQFGMSTTDDVQEDLVDQQKMDNDFFGIVASANYDNRRNLQATVGGGWNRYNGSQFGHIVWTKPGVVTTVPTPASLSPDFEYYRNNSRKTDFNVYGKGTYLLTHGLSAFLDLQYRHVRYMLQNPTVMYGANADGRWGVDNSYDFFNPKAGLNYDITPQHKLYASYGIGHKEPVRNNFMQQVANPDRADAVAKAEQLGDLEAGYKFQSPRFSAGANIYWMNYKDQLVLTGELNAIGEALTKNLDKSYRLGVEVEAAWKPLDWLRWDANATWSRNRVKDMGVTLTDGTNVNIGDKPLAFSPDIIVNNIFTFTYKGMKAAVQSQYVGDQYLTNTGFRTMECQDEQGNTTHETLLLKKHFNTNIDLAYTFKLHPWGIKEATVGLTFYNIFSAKYDNNGWAAPQFVADGNGGVKAVNEWGVRDSGAAGFAPSAPFNVMAHLSVNF